MKHKTYRQRTKVLYSNVYECCQIQVRCSFNFKTGSISISTGFSAKHKLNGKRNSLRTKMIYSNNVDGAQTTIHCRINENTGSINFGTYFRKATGWNDGSKTNPTCGAYLGVTVAEKALLGVFENATQMPVGNKGYDFICSGGYKIDVKSTCSMKNSPNSWKFSIKRNTTADYFLCIAFDDRDNLNPQHVWLIPGHVVNHLEGATISLSTLDKWSKYELVDKLDKVIKCCDSMR